MISAQVLCIACSNASSYQDKPGQSDCAACPANSQRLFTFAAQGESVRECLCKPGYFSSARIDDATEELVDAVYADPAALGAIADRLGYAPDRASAWGAAGVECIKCPDGGTCRGELVAPYNNAGFWGDEKALGEPGLKDLRKLAYYECEDGKEQCRKRYECAPGPVRKSTFLGRFGAN